MLDEDVNNQIPFRTFSIHFRLTRGSFRETIAAVPAVKDDKHPEVSIQSPAKPALEAPSTKMSTS